MLFHNYHTHTLFCDGKDSPEQYVLQAIQLGLGSLGFSGHAPVPFENNYAILPERLKEYVDEILFLKQKYKDQLPIFLSLEMDYIPGISIDFQEFEHQYPLDYTLGSVHLVKRDGREGLWFIDGPNIATYDEGLRKLFDNDIQLAVEAYYKQIEEMVLTQHPAIIGHFDKIKMLNRNRYFSEKETWYKKLVTKTLTVIKEDQSIVEVNTRGLYKKRTDSLFPSNEILEEILDLGIPITLNSDAHLPTDLDLQFKETIPILKSIGFKAIKVLNEQGWVDQEW